MIQMPMEFSQWDTFMWWISPSSPYSGANPLSLLQMFVLQQVSVGVHHPTYLNIQLGSRKIELGLTRQRETLLVDKGPSIDEKRVTFVSIFTHVSNKVCDIIRTEWHILGDTLNIEEFKNPPYIAYRHPTNLRDQLVKADFKPQCRKRFPK